MLLVGGDLEHRVRRGIDDRLAAGDVFRAEGLDHRHPGGVAVAEHAGQLGLRDQRRQQLRRKALLMLGEIAPLEQCRHAGDLPVAGGGVLAGGDLARAGPAPGRLRRRRHPGGPAAGGTVMRVIEAELCQIGQFERASGLGTIAGDMPQGVGTGITEGLGIGGVADAEGVEHQQHGTAGGDGCGHGRSSWRRVAWTSGGISAAPACR